MKQPTYIKSLGVMSGTSLDGIDLCLVEFNTENLAEFSILKSNTVSFPEKLRKQLSVATELSGIELTELDIELGAYIAQTINSFIGKDHNLKADIISSHGHTVFHQPEKRFSLQIGSGHIIATDTGITTICDFRMKDVTLNGQGAPLVPIGDLMLFADYDQCLNIGGIANISFQTNGKRIGYDTCPANMVMNQLAQAHSGLNYDKDGKIAQSGKLNTDLLNKLNSLPYFSAPEPKTLGKEWVDSEFMPIIKECKIDAASAMRTVAEHISEQIAICSNKAGGNKLLITGGGAKNKFLIKLIKEKCKAEIHVPDETVIDFKEALIFALLGALRILNKNNCLMSATGAKRDNCGGVVYTP